MNEIRLYHIEATFGQVMYRNLGSMEITLMRNERHRSELNMDMSKKVALNRNNIEQHKMKAPE